MKDNQPTLKEDISTIWEAELPSLPGAAQTNKHGGRVEKRELWVSDILVGYSDWPFLAQVCRLERTVTRKGETSQEVAFAVTSLSPQEADATQLLTSGVDTGASKTGCIGCETSPWAKTALRSVQERHRRSWPPFAT